MSARPKIAIIASWYPTREHPVGGIFIQEQAQLLARVADVAVVAPRAQAWRGLWRAGAAPRFEIERHEGLTVFRPRWLSLPRQQGVLRSWHAFRVIRRCFERLLREWGRPDIVHAHSLLPAGIAAAAIGDRWRIPTVLTEHMSPFSALLATPRDRRATAAALAGLDRVLAVSDGLRTDIEAFCRRPVEVLPNLVRTDFFLPSRAPRAPGPFRFLTVGVLTEQKGVGFLLEAVRVLRERGQSDFELAIAGDGLLRPALERQTLALGLAGCVRFLGLLGRDEVCQEMQACDAFVLASLHESFGIVSAEAMACGKPVLATLCQGGRAVVAPDCGRLVPPGDAPALADAMQDFLCGRAAFDPARIRHSVVERFGEDRFLAGLQQVYAGLMGKDRGGDAERSASCASHGAD